VLVLLVEAANSVEGLEQAAATAATTAAAAIATAVVELKELEELKEVLEKSRSFNEKEYHPFASSGQHLLPVELRLFAAAVEVTVAVVGSRG